MNNNALLDASQFPGKNGGERIQAAIDSLGTKPKVIDVGFEGPDLDGRWFFIARDCSWLTTYRTT